MGRQALLQPMIDTQYLCIFSSSSPLPLPSPPFIRQIYFNLRNIIYKCILQYNLTQLQTLMNAKTALTIQGHLKSVQQINSYFQQPVVSPLSQHSTASQLLEIATIQKQIANIISKLQEKAIICAQVAERRSAAAESIPHWNIKPKPLLNNEQKMIYPQLDRVQWFWDHYLQINHEVRISIVVNSIRQIRQNNKPYTLPQCAIVHIHHLDQHSQCQMYPFSLIAKETPCTLNITHKVRGENIDLLREGCKRYLWMNIQYHGLVWATGVIPIEQLLDNDGRQTTMLYLPGMEKCVGWAQCDVKIEKSVIAPEIDHFPTMKRSVSRSPPARSPSPISHRSMMKSINAGFKIRKINAINAFPMVVRLQLANHGESQQISILQSNVKLQSIKLINQDEIVCRFELNDKQTDGRVKAKISNEVITFFIGRTHFYRSQTDEKTVDHHIAPTPIGKGIEYYAAEGIHVVKNAYKQSCVNGMLASIFLKSSLEEGEVFTGYGLQAVRVKKDQSGWTIYYLPWGDDFGVVSKTVAIILYSLHKQYTQIHILDLQIEPRSTLTNLILKQINLADNSQFYRLNMNGLTSPSSIYTITSLSSLFTIVNGTDFGTIKSEQQLIIQGQRVHPGDRGDISIVDDKGRWIMVRILFK